MNFRMIGLVLLGVILGGLTAGAAQKAPELWVATYNIRYLNPGDEVKGNGWNERAPQVVGFLKFHAFDLVAIQEGFQEQMVDLEGDLPGYGLVSYGRQWEAREGEQVGIFYRKERLELVEEGRFWLCETPEEPVKGWDAQLVRVCTWAAFRDREMGRVFYCFAAHFDHRGVQARAESGKLMAAKMAEIAGEHPAMAMGDFNENLHGQGMRAMLAVEGWGDARSRAVVSYGQSGTTNGFDAGSNRTNHIDFILLNAGWKVRRWAVLTDAYRDGSERGPRFASDHFPVVAGLEWGE